MVEKIKEILTDELCAVYCYNCQFNEISEHEAEEKYQYYGCDDCHRKYMGWQISENTAERMANKIVEEFANKIVEVIK